MSTQRTRVWVVSELYYPEETSTGYILTRIAEGLAKDFDVNVLCGQPSYSARGQRAPKREVHNGVTIRRCLATTLDKNVLLYRLLNLVTISLSILVNALRCFRQADLVLVVTNPPLLPFVIAVAGWLRRTRLLLVIHDVYPEVLFAAGMLKPESLASKLGLRLTQLLYRNAERIIVLGRDMQALVAGRLRFQDRYRVVVISNWADVELVSPGIRSQNKLLREVGTTEKFVIEYAGNMGHPNDMESILRAAKRLQAREDIHFLLLGSGSKRAWVEEQVRSHHLTDVTLLRSRPRSEQQDFLNACDVGVVSLVRGMVGVSVPSRMYNIMAAGKPIIAVTEDDSELAMVVREEYIGWVVSPGNVDQLVAAILEAHGNPARLTEMGQRARQVAETKYSFERVIESYHSLIQGLGDTLGSST